MIKMDSSPPELPEITAIVEVGKFHDNGVSNHSSEYENIGSFQVPRFFISLNFATCPPELRSHVAAVLHCLV